MAARADAGRPAIVQIGATTSTLKSYVLSPTTIGAYQRRPLSEYAAPIRIGPPDYDARQVASTVAFPDFSGGTGKYLPDTRQESNRSWLAQADTRFPGVVALPPKFTAASLPSQPTAATTAASFQYSNVNGTDKFYLAVGDRLYSVAGTTWSNVVQLSAGADKTYHLRRILLNPAGTLTEWLFWCRSDGSYSCSADPTVAGNWTAGRGGAAGNFSDAYQHPTDTRYYLYMDSTGVVARHDMTTVTQVGAIRNAGHFLGNMQGSTYMVDGGGALWRYDPTQVAGAQVILQTDTLAAIKMGCVIQNAQLAISDGHSIQLFHPTRPSRDITPGAPDGLPSIQQVTILGLFTISDRLIAVVNYTTLTATGLMEYKGGGWHFLSKALTGTWCGPSSGTDLPIMCDTGFGYDAATRRHWIASVSSGTYGTFYNTLPTGGEVPFVQEIITAGDGFETSGVIETGWHYLGLKGLAGPLLQLRLLGEMYDTNMSIVAKYRTNFDETSGWTTLGTLTSTTRTLTFASGAGVSFRVVRFRFELEQTGGGGGGSSSKSPNCSVSIDFLKVPPQLSGHIMTIDLDETRRVSRRPVSRIISDLKTLVEAQTLSVLVYEDQPTAYVKLEMPRETVYTGADGKKMGSITIVANEAVAV